MVLSTLHMCLDAGDFGLQRFDPRFQLLDRHGVEVLLCKRDERVIGLAREEFFQIHGGIVDPWSGEVNKFGPVTNVPSSMLAVVAPQPDGAEELALVEKPVPRVGSGEVLVKVVAAGVNRPDILGLEMAGEVVETSKGAEELIGQKVCALVAGGGYAEYCVAPIGTCLRVPDAITLSEAAAMPETLFTVWSNLFERGFAADGDWVLVHGGTSGIGTMAIALGRLFGLKVIVTCGSDEKCARALDLGAEAAVNYRTQDFVEAAKRLTGGKGVDVILDMVGGDYLPRNIAALADDGRNVSIAFQRGAKVEIAIPEIMRRRLTLTGSTLRPRPVEFKTMVADEIAKTVWPYVEGGRLKPVIDSKFPLAEAAAAHARMEAGDHIGKIVLEVSS